MKTIAIGLVAAMLAGTALAAPPPANLMPSTISGSGWNVMDLEGMRAWYIDKLGMKQLGAYPREGKPFEYIMGFEGAAPGTAILALLASPLRKPGPNTTGRLILRVPDSKALADYLATQGVPSRNVAPGAYFITDPEGNAVELYTPPKAG
jgi:catechol 2,3-dioxygenase-like lactoylglutathione lyase family enzyme